MLHIDAQLSGIILAIRCMLYHDGKLMEYLVHWDEATHPVWYTSEEITAYA